MGTSHWNNLRLFSLFLSFSAPLAECLISGVTMANAFVLILNSFLGTELCFYRPSTKNTASYCCQTATGHMIRAPAGSSLCVWCSKVSTVRFLLKQHRQDVCRAFKYKVFKYKLPLSWIKFGKLRPLLEVLNLVGSPNSLSTKFKVDNWDSVWHLLWSKQ